MRADRLDTRAIARAYDGRDRRHVAVRLRTCPFDEIDARLPMVANLVDIACGHGHLALLLASGAPERHVLAVDIDERKIEAAERARGKVGIDPSQVEFSVSTPDWLPTGPADGISIVDALYLLEPSARERLVRASARALAPGGLLLVKEMDMAHRAKAVVARSGELVMTTIAGITASSTGDISFAAPLEIEGWMQAEGLQTASDRWDRGYPVPHHAVIGRR